MLQIENQRKVLIIFFSLKVYDISTLLVLSLLYIIHGQYAVKVQRSLAPLSRFRGSHNTTAHEQQCCRFQSYAKSVPSPIKLTSEIDKA